MTPASSPPAAARCSCGHRGDEHSGKAPHVCYECNGCNAFEAVPSEDRRTEGERERDGQLNALDGL